MVLKNSKDYQIMCQNQITMVQRYTKMVLKILKKIKLCVKITLLTSTKIAVSMPTLHYNDVKKLKNY